jgi:alpha-D-xyloside xylohydrolase
LYEGLGESGIRVLGWHSPTPDHWANVKSRGNKIEQFKPALLHTQDGSVFFVPKARFLQGKPYFDFTHPQTVEYVREEFREWLRLGLAGTMVDDGDDVPLDALFHNGHTGRRMHNRFHYDYHKTFNQVFREVRGDDFILFARAAGPGCQQFTAFFAGDHPESFDGLEAVIHGGLSFSASGFPFWGSDIGGLLPRPGENLTEPVYLRWVAFAAFSPLMRAHGCSPREPWRFSERAVQVYAYYARLRMNLLPTIYSLAVHAHRTGIPLMRIGYLEFPDDPEVLKTERAYCFGDDLWFVPPTDAERSIGVYLPGKGSWTDLRTGETFPAGQRVNRPCDYGAEPLFMRQGAILLAELDEPTLSWGTSLTAGKRLCVVANANGEGSGRRVLHQASDGVQEINSSTADGSWRLTSGRWETKVGGFVVYGPPPQGVDWANRPLPCVKSTSAPAAGPSGEGWWYDTSQRCTKVRIEPPASEAVPDACLYLRYSGNGRKR